MSEHSKLQGPSESAVSVSLNALNRRMDLFDSALDLLKAALEGNRVAYDELMHEPAVVLKDHALRLTKLEVDAVAIRDARKSALAELVEDQNVSLLGD